MIEKVLAVTKALTTERLFLIILFVTLAYSLAGYGSDVYLHLTTGREIMTSGRLPDTDIFSFTQPGSRWVLHEWLYQLLLYYIYSVSGIAGLKILGAAILTTTLYLCKKNGEIIGASQFASWAATLLFFLAWLKFSGLRPHIITFLFFAANLHLILRFRYRGETKALYPIPLMMLFWVNGHGGFIIGIVLVAYVLVLTLFEAAMRRRHSAAAKPLLAILFFTLLASAFNPYGFEQLLFPFRLMDQWVMRHVIEWQAPILGEWNTIIYLSSLALSVILVRLIPQHERLFQLLLVSPFIAASFFSVRHVPIASFVVAPFLALQISTLYSRLSSRMQHGNNRTNQGKTYVGGVLRQEMGAFELKLNWIVLVVFLSILYLAHPAIHQKMEKSMEKKFPVNATRFLIENDIRGRMFTTLQYSDYILFARYPAQKLFYDVRHELYGETLARDYLIIANAHNGWQETFNKYSFDFAVVDKSKPIYIALASLDNSTRVYEDDYSAIFTFH